MENIECHVFFYRLETQYAKSVMEQRQLRQLDQLVRRLIIQTEEEVSWMPLSDQILTEALSVKFGHALNAGDGLSSSNSIYI